MSGWLDFPCVGISTPALASYPLQNLGGHELMALPGGLFVMGSSQFTDATPHWVLLSRLAMGRTLVSEGQFKGVMDHMWKNIPDDQPTHFVSYQCAEEYVAKRGNGLRLPTEAELEYAYRGPAVSMREAMEAEMGRFSPDDFVDFAAGRFENFVFEVTGHIHTDPRSDALQRLIRGARTFYGWRVFATPSGRHPHGEAWYAQRRGKDVLWGPVNPYGLHGTMGYISVWAANRYTPNLPADIEQDPRDPEYCHGTEICIRGGSIRSNDPSHQSAAYRYHGHSKGLDERIGFRVAASITG